MDESLTNVTPSRYGEMPTVVGNFDVEVNEMMAYLYLPVNIPRASLAHQQQYYVPKRLHILSDVFHAVYDDFIELMGLHNLSQLFDGYYIYFTVKHLFVTADNPGNRPGFHCDGFLSDDINYVWCDTTPTVFCIQNYHNVIQSHHESLDVFEEQSNPDNEIIFPENTLLRLTPYVVHRTPDITEPHMRTFMKVSISKERYNLKGNSHNYGLDYDWTMYDRSKVRNHPIFNEVDFYKG